MFRLCRLLPFYFFPHKKIATWWTYHEELFWVIRILPCSEDWKFPSHMKKNCVQASKLYVDGWKAHKNVKWQFYTVTPTDSPTLLPPPPFYRVPNHKEYFLIFNLWGEEWWYFDIPDHFLTIQLSTIWLRLLRAQWFGPLYLNLRKQENGEYVSKSLLEKI